MAYMQIILLQYMTEVVFIDADSSYKRDSLFTMMSY